jgi:hypothetical protein
VFVGFLDLKDLLSEAEHRARSAGFISLPESISMSATIFIVAPFRIALANLAFPATAEKSVAAAERAIAEAAIEHADIICFPECFVPGYRAPGENYTVA